MTRYFRILLLSFFAVIAAQPFVRGGMPVNILFDAPALRHHAQQLGEWVKEARRYAQDAIKLKRMMENGNIAVAIAGEEIVALYDEVMKAMDDWEELKKEFSSWDANYGIKWKISNKNAAELTEDNKKTLFTSNMWDGDGNPFENSLNIGGVFEDAWEDSGAGEVFANLTERLRTPEGRIKAAIERKLKSRNKQLEKARYQTVKMTEEIDEKILKEQEVIGEIQKELKEVSTMGSQNGRELRLSALQAQLSVAQSRLSGYQSMAANAEINQNLMEREAKEAKQDLEDMQDLQRAAIMDYYERKAQEEVEKIRERNRESIQKMEDSLDEVYGTGTVSIESINESLFGEED
jgi:uncharacterized protein YdhG (YjbR/CyaY superfamily)